MQAGKLQAGYALMDPAFLRQVVSDTNASSNTKVPAGQAPRTPWRAWYGEAATRLSTLAAGIAGGRRKITAPTARE